MKSYPILKFGIGSSPSFSEQKKNFKMMLIRLILNGRNTILFFILFITSCNSLESDKSYKFTKSIGGGLFVETYNTFGSGAFGSDMICNFLTDSVNFRYLIPNYDEAKLGIEFKCVGDSLIINKYFHPEGNNKPYIIESNFYKIDNLKKTQNIGESITPLIK